MSAAAFARQYKLNYTTFCGWRHRRAAQASAQFVQVEISPQTTPAELIIELGTAARMRIHCADQIGLATQLLQNLNAPRSC